MSKATFFRCRACPNVAAPEAVSDQPPEGATVYGSTGPYWKLPRGWTWKDGEGPLCSNHNGHGEALPKPVKPVDVPAKVVPIESAKYAGPIDYGDTSCVNCGSVRFQRAGSCLICIDCRTSNGCS